MATAALSNDALFRIEVSLSSRKSSAIVMKTHARLYTLDKSSGSGQWKSLAYGAPCIQLMRETTAHNSPFHIKLVIAEVESGISLWECELTDSSGYNSMQPNFHTFSNNGRTLAVQFASVSEGQRMLDSLNDLFAQKQKAETVSFESKPDEPIFKKPKPFKRMSKKDISAPCNFKHVSGITVQRTQMCEDELRGTIQRKLRSNSISNISVQRVNQEASGESPSVTRSILNKFGSLRSNKKKVERDVDLSLPSHARQNTRPPIQADTYNQPHPSKPHPHSLADIDGSQVRRTPNRSLSFSSNDLTSRTKVVPSQTKRSDLKRRHTIIEHQFNYVPYRERRYTSDAELNRAHYQVPTVVASSAYQVPRPVYQVPNSQSAINPSTRAIPYAVVPIPAQHEQPRAHTRMVPPTTFRMERPQTDYSPSHAHSKVAPPTSHIPVQGFQGKDSLVSYSSTSMDHSFTDQMAKALEQFDSLLPTTKKQIIQTSL